MARSKGKVITSQELPQSNLQGPTPAANSMETFSESAPSSATTSTGPHASSSLSEMPSQDFPGHVSFCTQPSTAEEISSDSSLTPPPESPSIHAAKHGKPADEPDAAQINSGTVNGSLANVINASDTDVEDEEEDNKPNPYIKYTVEYYDKIDDREGSVITRRNSEEPDEPKTPTTANREGSAEEKPEPKIRHPFPKFTPFDDFGDYLVNAEDISYEELYDRTSHVASVLVDYQKEWDGIDKEIYKHESLLKAQAKKAAEVAKAAEEERSKVEDQIYLEIAQDYRAQLKFSRVDWEQYLDSFGNDAKSVDTVERLRSLRLPNFLSGIHKRQKGREQEPNKLVDRPLMAERITKEELAMDKKKRGRLIDQITFEDMKQADVYGFNYSSQPHHVGNQPQPSYNGKSKAKGDMSDEGRSRSQRNKAQKNYDPDKSASPETENEELPAKRARKPRMNLDMALESQHRGRNASRGGTPAVRTFPSGKRVGRPPTKSKLKDFEVPPESTETTLENGTGPRKLAPREEEQLQDAAASLASKQRKMVVGRNREYFDAQPEEATFGETRETSRPSSSSSNEGSRKRKRASNNVEREASVFDPSQMTPILPSNISVPQSGSATPVPGPAPKSRKRKAKDEEIDESLLTPEQLEALRKKRAKSAKLSESLRKRWEKGEMAGAMETRKATNAAKKAAKAGTGSVTGGTSEPPAIVPPNHLHPVTIAKNIQPQPIAPADVPPEEAPAPVAQPAPKRKQSIIKSQHSPPSAEKATAKGKKRANALPPVITRKVGGRARKPSRLRMMDEEEEDEEGVMRHKRMSEYDHFQALTSPGSEVVLGKRVRKNKIPNLAEAMDDDFDEGEDDY